MSSVPTYRHYQQELRRIAWRLQYRARVKHTREMALKIEIVMGSNFTEQSDSKLFIHELLSSLTSDKARHIISEIYIHDKSEKEVALDMQLTQQGVNKWKRNSLKTLSQKLNSWS